jgi:hypothetical protein
MIHQVKPNPQLLDQQIFSERLASGTSAIGTESKWALTAGMSAVEGKAEKGLRRLGRRL